MAFTDPQTVTINSIAHSLARTGSGLNTGAFSENDGTHRLSVSHTYGRRTRRVIRLDSNKIAADPLISAQNIKYNMATYVVFDVPVTGYTVAEAKLEWDGFAAFLAASSGAKITQLLGGEN
jgi:hypothetical protein